MYYRRDEMRRQNIKSAADLRLMENGRKAVVAGAVITRQRPGTAKGLIFVTLEDETGNANVIVMPDVYERYRQQVLEPRFIRLSGTVQNQDGIVHLRAERVEPLAVSAASGRLARLSLTHAAARFFLHSIQRLLVARLSFRLVAADGDRSLPSSLPELLRNVMRFPRNAAIALPSRSRSASNSAMIVAVSKKTLSLMRLNPHKTVIISTAVHGLFAVFKLSIRIIASSV
jgi:hypothetical protein